VSREVHAAFCEQPRGKFPRLTYHHSVHSKADIPGSVRLGGLVPKGDKT